MSEKTTCCWLTAGHSSTTKEENVAGIITPDGYKVPLHLDEDGKVIIPTPAEIEEMIANGEGEYMGHPADANQPPLTEEEWKMRETLHQLEEAARQQE